MRWKRKKFLVLIVIVLVVLYVGVYVMPLYVTDSDISVLDESKSHVDLDENFYAQPGNSPPRNLKVKRDWHDYKVIEADQRRTGPGEQGAAVHVSDSERGRSAYAENGFNIKVSDRISLNRSLSDIRHKNCRSRTYLSELPTTSVIIPFHNEGWSTLFRSLHSILNRTPPKLLFEIILIDDCSTNDHLKQQLDEELIRYQKVKLYRLRHREGLIRARLAGVKRARGEVIVILDSHIEVTHNWLPPLLEPIALDRKTLTCPMIDIINMDNFHYITQPGDAMRGAFDWELYYKRIPIPPEKQPRDPSDPFEDPVMAGGLFAVDRSYFDEIGRYDSGLEIWGGEQYELSFKVWMCGGRIMDAPCSRVGHIYRQFMPYSLPPGTNINKNYKRVAEVWMDEYKEYFYKKRPFARSLDPGDLEEQKNLRVRLQCKSFHWFMTEVAPDIVKYYPPVLPKPTCSGKIQLDGSDLCIDARHHAQGSEVVLTECKEKGGFDQDFLFTWKDDIRPGLDMDTARGVCLDGQTLERPVLLWNCHGQRGNQLWRYQADTKQLSHGNTGNCITAERESNRVLLMRCKSGDRSQAWTWNCSRG